MKIIYHGAYFSPKIRRLVLPAGWHGIKEPYMFLEEAIASLEYHFNLLLPFCEAFAEVGVQVDFLDESIQD